MNWRLAAAGIALSAAIPCGATLAADRTQSKPAQSAELEQLLDVMVDEDILRDAMFQGVDSEFQNLSRTDAELGSLFKEHPGLEAHLVQRTKEKIASLLPVSLPDLRARFATLLTEEMTQEQIVSMSRFFATPSGQALYKIGVSKGVKEELTGQKADYGDAEVFKSIRKEDIPVMLEFDKTGAAGKLTSTGPKLAEISAGWSTDFMTEHGSDFEQAGAEATIEFLSRDAEAAKKDEGTTS